MNKMIRHDIQIKEIEVDGKSAEYFDVTINGDTWSCRTIKDCLEMCEEVLIK